ncbi:hypothetical protein CENSYa_0776 [Cenarchaeum symbiosum A]|uniref:Uncharacterized protein n=1 Tax=Cenarchaeum symbiosum (strain A) TaxID=414004 RepID=A0RVP2_CENSY|nr:hypothetical protein CENSYa_0776 [Cenarchaeum symbiosum A]
MPDVKCAGCMKMIYAPDGGSCTICLGKSPDATGPREYLIERAVSAVRYIEDMPRMGAILEYACRLLDAYGIEPPFVLRDGRIDRAELEEALRNLEDSGHMTINPSRRLDNHTEFLLVEEHFTKDDSGVGEKIIRLTEALNCHSVAEIHLLVSSRFPGKPKGAIAGSSGRIRDLLSGSPKDPPEWIPIEYGLPLHRDIMDDTYGKRISWKSMGKKTPFKTHPMDISEIERILGNYPALADCDFDELSRRHESRSDLF